MDYMLPFLWTTSTYSTFQHITIDYICHTHCLLNMAKTNSTNPHSEEPTHRSNWTAGKSPASVDLPAIMPIWWKRSQWRLQFPLETCPEAKITIKSVKEGRLPDYSLRLCPDWTTGNKAGRPKKGERIKLGLETAMAKGKGGTTRTKATKRQRCDVCGAYGQMYENCFLLEKSEEIEHAGIQVLPIEETIRSNNEWADGDEAPL